MSFSEKSECEKQCATVTSAGEIGVLPGGGGQPPASGQQITPAGGAGQATESILDDVGPLTAISTNCQPCKPIVKRYNEIVEQIKNLESRLLDAQKRLKEQEAKLESLAQAATAYDLAKRLEKGNEYQSGSSGYLVTIGSGGAYFWDDVPPDSSNSTASMNIKKEKNKQELEDQQDIIFRAQAKIDKLEAKIAAAYQALEGLKAELTECEKQCRTVHVIDTKGVLGNDPYNPRDPIAGETQQQRVNTGGNPSVGGPSTPIIFVQVVNNIPISRLTLIPPEAGCAFNHYHDAANNCNGVLTFDPDPLNCGHGTVNDVISIPKTSCPDLP